MADLRPLPIAIPTEKDKDFADSAILLGHSPSSSDSDVPKYPPRQLAYASSSLTNLSLQPTFRSRLSKPASFQRSRALTGLGGLSALHKKFRKWGRVEHKDYTFYTPQPSGGYDEVGKDGLKELEWMGKVPAGEKKREEEYMRLIANFESVGFLDDDRPAECVNPVQSLSRSDSISIEEDEGYESESSYSYSCYTHTATNSPSSSPRSRTTSFPKRVTFSNHVSVHYLPPSKGKTWKMIKRQVDLVAALVPDAPRQRVVAHGKYMIRGRPGSHKDVEIRLGAHVDIADDTPRDGGRKTAKVVLGKKKGNIWFVYEDLGLNMRDRLVSDVLLERDAELKSCVRPMEEREYEEDEEDDEDSDEDKGDQTMTSKDGRESLI